MRVAVLARHGESACSAAGLLNGDPARPCPLTDAGRAQARALGVELAGRSLDLCLTSPFPRTRETAAEALAGRDLPTLVLPELGDPAYGEFEGRSLVEYRGWAAAAGSREPPPGGGESRHALAARYERALQALLARPEGELLVVAHSLPIAYTLAAARGEPPRPRMPLVAYALPFELDCGALELAATTLAAWVAEPDW